MSRTPKSSKHIYEKIGRELDDPDDSIQLAGPDGSPIHFTRLQKMSAVLELMCKGLTAAEVSAAMKQRYGQAGFIKREDPYEFFSYAARHGWIVFKPPPHLGYEGFLRRLFPWLHAEVVNTTVSGDVAARAARTLLGIVQGITKTRGPKSTVHIGLAGGITMRKFANRFADLLCRAPQNMPEVIRFHPLVSGFDPYDPTTDPNSFVSYYWNQPAMQVKPEFRGFRAPAIVTPAMFEQLKDQPGVRDAFAEKPLLDVIVTSGSDCPEHGAARLWREYGHDGTLSQSAEVGDILWRPIDRHGPIANHAEYRAMTLMELSDLPDFVARGKHVLLMVGPCGGCHRPKQRLLRIVVAQERPIITHLVADSRSTGAFVRQYKEEHAALVGAKVGRPSVRPANVT